MKIKINKCSSAMYWYSGKIGKTFRVISETKDDYHVIPEDGLWVSKKDCSVVSREETNV